MKSKLKYIWNLIVFLIFVFYFNLLYKKSKLAVHISSFTKLEISPSILFCVSLQMNCGKKFKTNGNFKKSELKNETMKDLICHLNTNISPNPKSIIEEAEKWNFLDAFYIQNSSINKKKIFLYDYHLCANYDLNLNQSHHYHTFKFPLNNLNVKTYLYPAKQIHLFLGINIFSFNSTKKKKFISSLSIKTIEMHDSNYEKFCVTEYRKKFSPKCSKLICFKSCFKNKTNSKRFLYTKKDDLIIEMDNQVTNPIDKKCLSKCFENFHGYFYYLKKTKLKKKNTKTVEFIFDSNISKIKSKLLDKKFLFLEISSLISVLFGFNYLSFLLNFLFELVKIFKIKNKILIKKVEVFILTFVVINLLFDCSSMIQTYKKFIFIKTSTSLILTDNKSISISACFDVKKIVKENEKKGLAKPLVKNSIFSLKKKTLNFENIYIESNVKLIGRFKNIKIDTKKVKIFYLSEFSSNSSKMKIHKCFYFEIIEIKDLVQNLLGNPIMKIKFKKNFSFFFLTGKNIYPNSETKKNYFVSKFRVFRKILKEGQLIINCKNYEGTCRSQKECVDNCFLSKYQKKYNKLPSNIPFFLKSKRKTYYKNLFFDSRDLINKVEVQNIKNYCLKLFPLVDCYQQEFKPGLSLSYSKANKVTIFLYSFIITYTEFLLLNKYELISKIINIFSIWLGLSIPNLIEKLFTKINKRILVKFNNFFKNSFSKKFFYYFFNLTMLMGLSYNLYSFVDEILKQSKITTVNYKLSPEIEYPFITICVDYKKKPILLIIQNLVEMF